MGDENRAVGILITNDDGYFAEGLIALRDRLSLEWDVLVVAPDREQSGTSHSLTMHRPLRMEKVEDGLYRVDGTPTDCVLLAARGVLGAPVSVVVSGINRGANIGDDVTYSGTVAAAMEGTLLGIPSLAVSLDGSRNFSAAAEVTAGVVRHLCVRDLPEDTFLNVNVPDLPLAEIKGVAITRQSRRSYIDQVVARRDPRGREYYWIAGSIADREASDGSDFAAVGDGYVSVTPLHLDLTKHAAISVLEEWGLDLKNGK